MGKGLQAPHPGPEARETQGSLFILSGAFAIFPPTPRFETQTGHKESPYHQMETQLLSSLVKTENGPAQAARPKDRLGGSPSALLSPQPHPNGTFSLQPGGVA